MKNIKFIILLCCNLLISSVVFASDIGKGLTPIGAEQAGNKDGSIPAWTGGIQTPPAGYVKGKHHVDPFASDTPYLKINASNAEKFKANLSPGQLALLKKYPDYFMNIYPTHRSASYTERVYKAVALNDKNAELVNDGNGVKGAKISTPFPRPKNGLEAIWNHLLRYRGEQIHRRIGQANPTVDGEYTMIQFDDDLLIPYAKDSFDGSENIFAYFIQRILGPARLAGEVLLVHETIDQVLEPRQAWTYNPGQRRVRRAPNVAYDNPGTASDGLRTSDQLDIFNGAPNLYSWKLKGKKELYVPYNAYKLQQQGIPYDTLIQAGHLNPDYLRFEKHRVWEVEATLKSGKSNIYSKRVFYLDEDSWQILVADHYDGRGEIWRLAEVFPINYYEKKLLWSTLDIIYDLQSGRYTAVGFKNNESVYDFDQPLAVKNFSPSSLRRKAKR